MFEQMVSHFGPEWAPKLYSLMDMPMCLNTSNEGKQAEYQRMAGRFGASFMFTDVDLEEPNADHDTVVVYKATMADQFHCESVCEDSALYIKGCDHFGVNIKWMLDNLGELDGCKAKFVVKLGWAYGGKVYVATGTVYGRICSKKEGEGFGFDPYFVPEGASIPYSIEKPDHLNPRYIALKNFFDGEVTAHDPIKHWDGEFQ
jgi:XTP/dITP diphosphohydrolase